jgi:hypothetical protein
LPARHQTIAIFNEASSPRLKLRFCASVLDDPDLCRDICVLASKSVKAQPHGNWNAIVPRTSKNLKLPILKTISIRANLELNDRVK